MNKYFKTNQKYFNYINKNRQLINVISVKPNKNSIRLVFKKKSPEEIELKLKEKEVLK